MIRIDGLYTRSISDPSLYIIIGDKAYMTSVLEYRELEMKDFEPCGFPVSAVKKFVPMPKHGWRFRGLIERGKTYYFANDDCMEEIYGSEQPVCLSEHNLWEVADGWGITLEELMEQVHEASDAEIIKFGVIG